MGAKTRKVFLASILLVIAISTIFFLNHDFSIQSSEQIISRQQLPSTFSGKIHNSIIQEIQENPGQDIEVLIQLKQDNFDEIKQLLEQNGVHNIAQFEIGDIITADLSPQVLEDLSQDEEIDSIWPNKEYTILLDNTHEQINTNISWNLDLKGDNIKIAVLDTGIGPNDDFQDRIISQEVFTGEDHTTDGQGHGTHVAGIVAADGKYQGVAPHSLLLNAKVLTDKGAGTTKTILEGINWAVEQHADIISMSLGGPYSDPDGPINSALLEAIDQGITVVLASGNCNLGCGSFKGVTTPGDLKEAITVGAVDENNEIASFSSRQDFETYSKPEILAPGVNIISTAPNNNYAEKSGTSMSTPMVAGVVALLKQQDSTLTHSEIKQLLIENSNNGILDLSKLFGEQQEQSEEITNEVNENNLLSDGLLIEEDIGSNWFVDKSEFKEETSGYYGAIAQYQNQELYKLKVGVIVFDNEDYKDKFIEQNIKFTDIHTIGSQDLFFTSQEDYWFWISGNKFIWVLTSDDVTDEMKSVFERYLEKYNKNQYDVQELTLPIASQDYSISESSTQCTDGDLCVQNTACTDSCDSRAYKSDLSGGSCDLYVNYNKKGTAYSYEMSTSKTDTCVDSRYLAESYLSCDDSYGWCPGQGFYCYKDLVKTTTYDCTLKGSSYGCSSGECKELSCDYSPTCTDTKRTCLDSVKYTKYDKSTACGGGCTGSWNKVSDYICGSGSYCSGSTTDGSYPCYTCSKVQDGICQSSNCYGTDPDCKSDGSTYECYQNSQCGSGEVCSSGSCKVATCSDLGKPGSCSYSTYLLGYSACLSDNPTKCQKFGSIYCYDYTDTCTSSEYCDENGAGDSICKDKPCTVTSAAWSKSSAKEGEMVGLTAFATGSCSSAYFEIYENDLCALSLENYDPSTTTPEQFIEQNNIDTENLTAEEYLAQCFSTEFIKTIGPIPYKSGAFETSWITSWIPDISGDPEYFFKVLVGASVVAESPELPVSKSCPDLDGDGYGICTGDCDDSSKYIHPGATESCNAKDDNCNAKIDEGDVCLALTCGNSVCESTETSTNCPADCKATFDISSITSVSKSSANPGDTITFTALVKNTGSSSGSIYIEGAIVPDSWRNIYYSDISSQAVYDNPYGVCEKNTNYDYKIVDLAKGASDYVTFSVIVPNDKSIDECSSDKRSAWDTKFNLLVGTYATASGGEYLDSYYKSYMVNTNTCASIDGSSPECSCIIQDCGPGFTCDISSEACVPVSNCEQADGSSADCDCNSDSQCLAGYKCDLGPGWDACVEITAPDECSTIDQYSCKDGDVYRCENVNGRKQLLLSDICTVNEYCPSDVETTKACKNSINYDLKLEQASSKTIVNKQSGDTLTIQIDTQDTSVELTYDESAFTGSCGPFTLGTNICEFEVIGEAGKYLFKLNDDIEVVNIIENPYSLFITNIKQLNNRYKDPQGVSVLLAKTFEKAAESKGIVYDLNKELSLAHPFDSFSSYNEPLSCKQDNNEYAISTSDLVKDKCNNCKQTIIIGDDFVVPSYRRTVSEYTSYIFSSDISEETFYTDISLTQREKLLFSDFDEVFKIDGKYEGKNVLLVVPDTLTSEMSDQIAYLKETLEGKGYNPDFNTIKGNEVYCKDNSWFQDTSGKTLIIIGTSENNKAFECYPFISSETDTAFMERNLWDGDEYAVILNTNNPNVIKSFSDIIKTGDYQNLRSENAYFFTVGAEVVGYAAMGVGVAAMVIGSGGAAAPILLAGAIMDGVADSADVIDTCAVNFDGYGWCGASTALAVIPLVPSKATKTILKELADSDTVKLLTSRLSPYDDIIEKNFPNLRNKHFKPKLWSQITSGNDDSVNLAAGIKKLFPDLDKAPDIKKAFHDKFTSPPLSGTFTANDLLIQQADFIKNVGRVDEFIKNIPDETIRTKFTAKLDDLIKKSKGEGINAKDDWDKAKGHQFELESFKHENLDDLKDFSVHLDKNKIGFDGEIDKLRKDGTIIEDKAGSWDDVKDNILKQSEKYNAYQKKELEVTADILFRVKSDTSVPESVINAVKQQRTYLKRTDIYLELVDSFGNLKRFDIK